MHKQWPTVDLPITREKIWRAARKAHGSPVPWEYDLGIYKRNTWRKPTQAEKCWKFHAQSNRETWIWETITVTATCKPSEGFNDESMKTELLHREAPLATHSDTVEEMPWPQPYPAVTVSGVPQGSHGQSTVVKAVLLCWLRSEALGVCTAERGALRLMALLSARPHLPFLFNILFLSFTIM